MPVKVRSLMQKKHKAYALCYTGHPGNTANIGVLPRRVGQHGDIRRVARVTRITQGICLVLLLSEFSAVFKSDPSNSVMARPLAGCSA